MARKKKAPAKASTRNYPLSKGFLWGFWWPQLLLAILLGLLALGFASGNHLPAVAFFGLAALAYFLLFLYYLTHSIGKCIETAEDGVALVDRKGGRLFLRWNQVSRIEHRPILQQMVLVGPGDVRIPIQYLTKGFPELLKRILDSLDLHTPSTRVASSFADRSQSLALETKGVRLVRGSNAEFLEWTRIAKLELGTVRSLCSFLRFHLDLVDVEGNRHRFCAPLSQVLNTHMAVAKGLRKRGLPRPGSSRIAAVPEGTGLWRKHWRPILAGAFVITFPGYTMGRVLPQLTGPSGWWGLVLLILVLAVSTLVVFKLFGREVPLAAPAPRPKTPWTTAWVKAVPAFLIAFVVTGYFWRGIGNFFLESAKADVRAAGYSLEMPENAPKLPDGKNAAFYLLKVEKLRSARALFDDDSPDYGKTFYKDKNRNEFIYLFIQAMYSDRLSLEAVTAAGKLVSEQEEAFELLDRASKTEGVDWGIDYTVRPLEGIEIPKVVPYLSLNRLLVCQAYLQARKGGGAQALQTLRKGLFLADVVESQNNLLSYMVAAAIRKNILLGLRTIFPRVDARQVDREFSHLLARSEGAGGYLKAIQPLLFASQEEWAEKGWVEFCRNYGSRYSSGWTDPLFGVFYWPFLPFDQSAQFRTNLGKIQALQGSSPSQKEAWRSAVRNGKSRDWILGQISSSDSMTSLSKALEASAYSCLTRAATAVRVHRWSTGKWPVSVAELEGGKEAYLDPFTDSNPLRLMKTPDGILIYSLGMDGKDDGGTPLDEDTWAGDLVWEVKLPPGAK